MKSLREFTKTLFCVVAVLLISGCENFIQGSLLKSEIEAEINYQKTPSVNVFIQKADVDDNGTLYPSANGVNAKVGIESFKISYTASSTYYFLYWQAVDKENNILDSVVVKFDDPTKAVTSVTVYTESEVIIQAVTSPVPKAVVNFKKNYDAAGTVTTEDINSFMMDEEFIFSFVPADGYQFIKWQASNDKIEISNPLSLTAKGVAKADGAVTVTAVCAERPHVKSFEPNPSQTDSVCKDTSIIIDFDKPLGNSEEELSDIKLYLNNVELYYGEEEAFGTPYFYKSESDTDFTKVVIPAHSTYAVDVPAGKTSSIRVVLPDSLFTVDEENDSRIYLYAEGKTFSWTYKINENTNDKADIRVASDSSTGTLTGSNGKYNIGKLVEYSFKTLPGAQFIDWKYVCIPQDAAVITKATDNGVEKLLIDVRAVCQIDIEAVAAIRPSISLSETLPVAMKNGVPFDTEARIKFIVDKNNVINEEALLNGVSVSYDIQDLGEFFNKKLDGNELVLSPKEDPSLLLELRKRLFSSGITGVKSVKINIPASCVYYEYKYKDRTENVNMASDYGYPYNVNTSTSIKIPVKFDSTEAGQFTVDGELITEGGSKKEYSLGESFKLSLKPAEEYQFIGWQISNESAVEVEDEKSLEPSLFVKNYGNVSVKAVTAPRPKYSTNTASKETYAKDTSLYIEFDKDLAAENDLSKIVMYAGAVQLSYGEKEAFAEPRFGKDEEGNTVYSQVIIPANTFSALDVGAGKTIPVTVVLPSDLYYTDEVTGAKIYLCSEGSISSWKYTVNEKTFDEVSFELVSDTLAGTMAGKAGKYNLGTEVTYSFKSNSAYKFIGWKVDQQPNETQQTTDVVEFVKATDEETETISFNTLAAGTVKVEAVTVKRPSVNTTGISPAPVKNGVPFDTEARIKFNVDDKFSLNEEALLKGVSVFYGSQDLSEYFNFNFNENELVISTIENPARKIEMKEILFSSGNSGIRQLNVTIPALRVFYEYGGERVNMAADYVYQYNVNNTTEQKSKIKFEKTEAGTFTFNEVTATGAAVDYSLGEIVELSFSPSGDYKFIRWQTTDEDVIKIEDVNNPKTTAVVKKTGNASISAETVQKLLVSSVTPESKIEGVSKNSDIVITFNKAVANTGAQDLEKVKILLDGVDVKNCYEKPVISEDKKTVSFKADNKNFLPVEKGTKIVTVIVPSDFYYDVSEAVRVNLEEYSKSFVVNASTLEKATVNINSASGTIIPSGSYSYNIGDTFEVLYTPASGYKFTDWIIEKGTAKAALVKKLLSSKYLVRFYDDESKSTYKDYFEVTFTESIDKYQASFKVLEEISGCSIRPSYSLIPAVTSVLPAFSNSGKNFDENIEIEFNKSMNPDCFKGFYKEDVASTQNYAVSITDKNGMDLSALFNLPVGSEDNKKWTIRPDAGKIQTLLVTETFADIYVTVKTSATDSSEDAMHIEKEYAKSYRINRNHETIPPKIEVFNFASSAEKLAAGKYCSTKDFTSWSDAENGSYKYGEFSQNHIQSHLAFHIELGEYETDLEKLVLSEKRIKTVTTQDVNEDSGKTEFDLSQKGKKAVLDFDYDLKSNNDGVIELTFAVWDKTGNKAEKAVYVIRDTKYELGPSYNIWLKNGIESPNPSNEPQDVTSYDDLCKVCFWQTTRNSTDLIFVEKFYGDLITDLSDHKIFFEYWNYEDSVYRATCIKNTDYYYTFLMDNTVLDFSKTIYIKISVFDEVGNSVVLTSFIPSCTDSKIVLDNNKYKATLKYDTYPDYSTIVIFYKNDNGNTVSESDIKENGTYHLGYSNSYYCIGSNVYKGGETNIRLCGKMLPYTPNASESMDMTDITVPDFEILSVEPGPKSSGIMKVTLQLDTINPEFEYFYSYKTYAKHYTSWYLASTNYEDKTVTFDCELYQKFQLQVKLGVGYNGYVKDDSSKAKDCSFEGIEDNLPPHIYDFNSSYVNRMYNILNIRISDDNRLKMDDEGYSSLEFVATAIPSSINSLDDLEDFTEEEWNNKNKEIIKFIPAGAGETSNAPIPFAYFNAGIKYRVDCLMMDEFGNKKITKYCIFDNNTASLFNTPEIYKGDYTYVSWKTNETVTAKRLFLDCKDNNKKSLVEYHYAGFDGIEWNMFESTQNHSNWPYAREKGFKDESGAYKDSFYVVTLGQIDNYITRTNPGYSFVSDNTTAKVKMILANSPIDYAVLSDNKSLLFTAYSKYNLGYDKSVWNRCAGKTGYKQLDGWDIYAPDTANVPDGYYYCTMAVFADGEMRMTEVKQK